VGARGTERSQRVFYFMGADGSGKMNRTMLAMGRSKGRAGLAVLSLFLSFATPAFAEEAISEEAKLYFRNGVDLIQATPPNYQDAYYQFKLAFDKSKSWKVLGNLGLCALKLERDGEALQFYTEYLKGGGNDIDPDERAALEREMLLINGNTAIVDISASIPDVDLTDVRAGSAVPPQSYKVQGDMLSLRLRAGSHTLTATAPDGKSLNWQVTLQPGKKIAYRFDFAASAPTSAAPTPAATAPIPGTPPAEQSSGGSPLRTVGFVTAGVGGAALIGGVITGLMAKGKESEALDQCEGNDCEPEAEESFDSAASLATVTNVLLIGGGVLAAAGVGLIVFGGSSGAEQAPHAATAAPRLVLSPAVGPGMSGVWATGRF
jgi:hypothetical protein